MIDEEKQAGESTSRRTPLGTILLCLGGLIMLLMGAEQIGGLPFNMPVTWYNHRSVWLGLGVAALVSGFFLLTPPKGDERDVA